ncbi:MAG TPA: ABC transporter ATP-binding protein [Bryobacteraceae bacterium]|nr:ABC transporter ATP-binding protein [Bryobacteraceae bacterium]
MAARVIVRDLRKRYGSVEALRGVSFEVNEGEIFGLLGPNGAGKTTTVECIVGLREADEGSIELLGIDARRQPAEVREKIGASLQTTSLQDKITPREAIQVFGAFYRERAETRQLLERFALTEKADAAFDTLSGGQKQRLALALAFVNNPQVVFLDEPTSGLDAHARRDLHGEILRMKKDGCTVLLTTHNVEEAERLCDRAAIIDHGRVVASGALRELIAQSAAATTIFLSTAVPVARATLAALPGASDIAEDGAGVRFRAADVTRALAQLTVELASRGIAINELHVQKASLEDVLIEMTGGAS